MHTTTFLIFCILLGGKLFTQTPVTITEGDMADEGDEYIITNANPLIEFDPDDTGDDHVWDFGFLEPVNSDTSRWLDEEDTDPLYFFLWLSSDIAEQTGSDIITDYFTIEDVFNFYKKSSDEIALSGFAGSISGVPFPIDFDQDDVVYEFPLEKGNTFSSVASFDIDIPGIASWSETRNRTTTVDGWGTLITPYGVFTTLRTRSEIEMIDTIIYDVLEIPFTYISIEYKWLAEDGGIPVLQINAQNILGSETITQVLYRGEVVVDIVNTVLGDSGTPILYPSVTTGELYLQMNLSGRGSFMVEVVNCLNQMVMIVDNLSSGENIILLPASIEPGFYILVVRQNNMICSVHKFFKSK